VSMGKAGAGEVADSKGRVITDNGPDAHEDSIAVAPEAVYSVEGLRGRESFGLYAKIVHRPVSICRGVVKDVKGGGRGKRV
jgi:hypothetical protein